MGKALEDFKNTSKVDGMNRRVHFPLTPPFFGPASERLPFIGKGSVGKCLKVQKEEN